MPRLTINSSSPRHRYFAIKEALIHAVRAVHIPWSQMQATSLAQINSALSQYQAVYLAITTCSTTGP